MKRYILFFQDFFISIINFIIVFFLFPSKIFNSKKNNYSNDSIIILGNGESINSDINNIINYAGTHKILCVNFFLNSQLFPKLKPDFYCLTDKVFFKKTTSKKIENKKDKLITELMKINHSMTLLIPWNYKFSNYTNFIKKNKHIKIEYIPNIPIWGGLKNISQFLINNNCANPLYENVMIAAIYSSIRCNFQNIFLFGVDHNWIHSLRVGNNNELLSRKSFFYESEKITVLKDSFENNIKLEDTLNDFNHIIKSYHFLNNMALSKNITITNCCTESMIDGFKKGLLK